MKLAGSSGAGQELKSRFAMPVLRFCSGAVLLLAGLYGALLCFFQTFALPEAETALIWSLPTTLLFLIIYSLPKHRGLAYLAAFVLWGIAAFFVMREVVTGAVFVAEQFSTQASAVFPKLGHFAPPQAQEDLAACRMFFRVAQFPLTAYLAWAVMKAHSFFLSFLVKNLHRCKIIFVALTGKSSNIFFCIGRFTASASSNDQYHHNLSNL